MNVYQKVIVLVALMALPLVLLYMKGMDYPHVGVIGLTGITVAGSAIYALRAVRPSDSTD